MEWREMGRLAHQVGWAIEKRKGMSEGTGRDGSMITLQGMKKNLAEEKKGREEEKKGREEEKRLREESEKRADVEKRKKEEAERREAEEKWKREQSERGRAEEKKKMEERIRNLERMVEEMKSHRISSLDGTSVQFPQNDGIKREGNTLIHHGSSGSYRHCFIGGVMTSV